MDNSGNVHLTKQEQLYQQAMGEEALRRQQEAKVLTNRCTCHLDDAGKASKGSHHKPGCPNWRKPRGV